MQRLETMHSTAAKQIQGLPSCTTNAGCISTLGGKSMTLHVDIMRMLFIRRIILMPVHSFYKSVLLICLFHHLYNDGKHYGPTLCAVNAFRKYGLLDILVCALQTGEVCPMSIFKNNVKREPLGYESSYSISTAIMYPKLNLFCVHPTSHKQV